MKRFVIVCCVVFCFFAETHGYSVNVTEDESSQAEDENTDYDNVTDIYDELGANATDGVASRLVVGTVAVAADQPEFRYVVSITSTTSSGTRLCSGAIISSLYIITAASCVQDASVSTITGGTIVAATALGTGTSVIHPKYYTHPQEYDIALIKLETSIPFSNNVGIIKLAPKSYTDDFKDLASKTVRVASYGDPALLLTPVLSFMTMTVMPRSTCVREMTTRSIKLGLHQDCLNTYNGGKTGCTPLDKGAPVTYKLNTDTEYSLVGILTYFDIPTAGCTALVGSATPNVFTRIGPVWDLLRKYVPLYTNSGK